MIHRKDPTVRSYLIERLAPAGIDPRLLQSRLEKESDVSVRRALVLALGGFSAEHLQALEQMLCDLYENDPDPGIHAATGWVLRQGGRGERLKPIDQRLATGHVEGSRGWYVNKQVQTFAILRRPDSPDDGLPYFAIASTEVTVAEFRRFRPGHKVDEGVAAKPDCPVNTVSWDDAAAYCNWLSEKEGIPESQWCYVCKNGKWESAPDYQKREGYRLPTEAEWDYACRAGAETGWSCGAADEELVGRYAWWYGIAQVRGRNQTFPVSRLKPNDFGLFDMHGNMSEWCQDVAPNHAAELRRRAEDTRPPVKIEALGVVRGGNYSLPFRKVRCDSLGVMLRELPLSFEGFRPARSYGKLVESP